MEPNVGFYKRQANLADHRDPLQESTPSVSFSVCTDDLELSLRVSYLKTYAGAVTCELRNGCPENSVIYVTDREGARDLIAKANSDPDFFIRDYNSQYDCGDKGFVYVTEETLDREFRASMHHLFKNPLFILSGFLNNYLRSEEQAKSEKHDIEYFRDVLSTVDYVLTGKSFEHFCDMPELVRELDYVANECMPHMKPSFVEAVAEELQNFKNTHDAYCQINVNPNLAELIEDCVLRDYGRSNSGGPSVASHLLGAYFEKNADGVSNLDSFGELRDEAMHAMADLGNLDFPLVDRIVHSIESCQEKVHWMKVLAAEADQKHKLRHRDARQRRLEKRMQ